MNSPQSFVVLLEVLAKFSFEILAKSVSLSVCLLVFQYFCKYLYAQFLVEWDL